MNPGLLRIFILLLLAHFLGDFVIHFSWLSRHKHRWYGRLVHSLIHAALAYLLVGAWSFWQIPVFIGITHYLIDWGKAALGRRRFWMFALDQLLHFAAVVLLSVYLAHFSSLTSFWLTWQPAAAWDVTVVLTGALLLVPVGGYIIGKFMRPFQKQLDRHAAEAAKLKSADQKPPIKGFDEGGRIIGYLERLLILVFVLASQYAGIGFLVAAKSIFHFGELKESTNRMDAEYIIIGTFASFLYAIVVSEAVRWLLTQ